MEDLQQENMDISEQNEGLKEGAKEGIQHLPELEQVQEEVEYANDLLVEQAEQIKQLLAQNKQLKDELDDYI